MSRSECGLRSAESEPRPSGSGGWADAVCRLRRRFSSSLKPQVSSLFFLLLLAALPAAAQTIYTENWTSLNSNWTVVAGTPIANAGYLRNADADPGTTSRLLYSGALQIQDYSVQSPLLCQSLPSPLEFMPSFHHYLRASGGNYYEVRAAWTGAPSSGAMTISVYRFGSAGAASLGSTTATCAYPSATMKSQIQGSAISVTWNGTPILSASDSSYASGSLGVGTYGLPNEGGNSGIGQTVLAYADNQPPSVPTGLAAVPYSTRVNLSWNASTDNFGVAGYKIYRNGGYIGSSSGTTYTDVTVDPLTAYNYTVSAYDGGNNESAQSTPLAVTTQPLSFSAPEAGGPVEYASAWGAGPEKIALLTSALALRVPLFKLQHRTRGPGFQMMASWNSQFWSWDASGTKLSAIDTGYGLGWNFTLGGIYPVYSGNELVRFELVDAAGVIHKLPPTGAPNQYKSNDSTYLLWDNVNRTLTFTGGTVWSFDCVSRYPEPDAGTRYPTRLKDTNGNLIDIVYQPASGLTGTNSSARLSTITDSATTLTWTYTTINGAPHVTLVRRTGAQTGVEDATFTYAASCIGEPFSGADPTCPQGQNNATLLTEIKFASAPDAFKFQYNASAEITKVTFPLRGYFRYTYITASFSNNGRKVREISARFMAADGTATSEQAYNFSHPSGDASLPQHTQTTLLDPANNKKVWFFIQGSPNGWDNGLENKYEVRPGPSFTTVLRTMDTTWTQDNPASQSLTNPRVSRVITALEDGITKNKREQDVDSNGNLTQVRDYDFDWATVPFRTASTTYVNNTNYTSRNILNRPAEVRVCAGVAGCATPASVTTFTYDGTFIAAVESITQHDSNYGPTFLYRGNTTQANANGVITTQYYDEGGNLRTTSDGLFHTVSSANYNSSASQVASVSSGGNTTSLTYNPDTTPNSATGSNSDTISFTYSSYRPRSVQRPDGTTVSYSYADMNQFGQLGNPWTYPFFQTESSAAGTKTTYLDGFGRAIKTAVKENATTWIYTETQYSACSCSSTGKAVKTSRPYRAGQTPVWTETLYDALGRPTRVTLPDANFTSYTYSVVNDGTWAGSLTLITDPAGKRKRYLNGMRGQLIRVEEPDAAGTLIETARYTYDVMGRLITVQMGKRPDNTFKQTRTFNYNTAGQLTSATNPENGAVSYTYFADGLPQSKTDARGITLWFFYDAAHRLLRIESPQGTVKSSFTYDTNPNFATSYAQGRMTSAANDGYTWHLSYDIMGRVQKQTLQTPNYCWNNNNSSFMPCYVQAQYGYDGAGRLKDLYYPGEVSFSPTGVAPGQQHQYSYDLMGRALSLIRIVDPWTSYTLAQNAQYNAASQITSWQESGTLTRTYNDLRGWVTNINGSLNYSYLPNGQASAVTEGTQTTTYEYDNLNRLTRATHPNWALQWTYDEFGNRLTQTKVPGSAGTPPEITLSYGESTNRITTAGYTYDANGNLTAMPGLGLGYDVFDRLASVSTSSTTTHKYDAFGRRIERRYPNGAVRFYFYDMGGKLLTEYRSFYLGPPWSSFTTVSYQYFAGQRVGSASDRIGSSGGSYYPFGEEITGTANDTYKFADLYRDADTGLDYAMNRYYGSSTGRFLTTDPKGCFLQSTVRNYYPFAEAIGAVTAANTHKFAFSFGAQTMAFDYLINLDYSSSTGQVLTPGPYQSRGRPLSPHNWNRYPYVNGDPINYNDPEGLDPEGLENGGPCEGGECLVMDVGNFGPDGLSSRSQPDPRCLAACTFACSVILEQCAEKCRWIVPPLRNPCYFTCVAILGVSQV